MINTKFILYLEAGGWAQVYVLLGSGSEWIGVHYVNML